MPRAVHRRGPVGCEVLLARAEVMSDTAATPAVHANCAIQTPGMLGQVSGFALISPHVLSPGVFPFATPVSRFTHTHTPVVPERAELRFPSSEMHHKQDDQPELLGETH